MEDKIWANPDFVSREIAGECILVPVGRAAEAFNGLASLNETGAFLWGLLAEPRTRGELAEALAGEYELTMEQSLRDVNEFLDLAAGRNLVLNAETQTPEQ